MLDTYEYFPVEELTDRDNWRMDNLTSSKIDPNQEVKKPEIIFSIREKGAEISWAADYYNGVNYIVLKPKVTLTDRENWKLWEAYMMLDPAKYQKGNFLSWITYLKTGWFLTKKGSRRLYCFEMCARISAAIGRWPEGKSLDMVSVFDLIENQNYEKI